MDMNTQFEDGDTRNDRRQRYKGRKNFKDNLRVEYIKEKKERQRRMQRGESTPEKTVVSTRCKLWY